MGDWFGIVPQAPCVLTPIPDYLAADAPAAYYTPPAPDGSRPGEYHVNLHDPTSRGRAETAGRGRAAACRSAGDAVATEALAPSTAFC